MSEAAQRAGSGSCTAVVDCGTNTTRLLVTDGTGLGLRMARITGLGRGQSADGSLDPHAVARTVAALEEFREVIDAHDVTAVAAVATSAVRDAADRHAFLDAATASLGCTPRVLSGDAEASYGFVGATSALDGTGPCLVVDIGGGSTEFSYGTPAATGSSQRSSTTADVPAAGPQAVCSVDMGSVRFTERFLSSDPPAPEELSAAVSVARLHLDDIDREHRLIAAGARSARLVGIAGTITTVAAVELGLEPYDPAAIDGFVLTRAAVEDVFRTLATESLADRIHNPGLHRERASVIVGGCCVLVAVMRHWGLDECLVSERDLLDGVASELADACRDASAHG